MRLSAGLALLVLFIASCASCASNAEVAGDRRTVGDVTMSFTISPARTDVGRSVRFAIRLTNSGGRPEVLDFASGKLYDFWVTSGDDEVWRWSDDRSFTQALQKETIASQDSRTFAESWTTEETGSLVGHGTLFADGFDRELTGRFEVVG